MLRKLVISGVAILGTAFAGSNVPWLRVQNGNLVDDSGRVVILKGFNWPELEYGTGAGSPRLDPETVEWFSDTFSMNAWRVPLNAAWWQDDVYVPKAGMHYRAWIQKAVEWFKRNGNYVILSQTTQYKFPPCGGEIAYCAAQDLDGQKIFAGRLEDPEIRKQIPDGAYIEPVAAMWKDLAGIYAHDPAILYDSFNEMHKITPEVWRVNTRRLIAAIREQSPQSVICVGGPNYKNQINPLIDDAVPDFSEMNLIYDFHVYPSSYAAQQWPERAQAQVEWARHHGKAVIFSEWGGRVNPEEYNQRIAAFAKEHSISLVFYCVRDIFHMESGERRMNPCAVRAQQTYALLDSADGKR